jgi:Rieske Fe-S protein
VNRRRFLGRLEAASAAAIAGAMGLPLSGCLGFHYVNATLVGNRLVIRHSDGSYTAVSTRCMHLGCQVEPTAGHLVCPCHGSEYTNDGRILKGPTPLPLRKFPVLVDGEGILIDLSAEAS